MEINSIDLLKQADRLRQRHDSVKAKNDIHQSDQQSQKSAQPGSDELVATKNQSIHLTLTSQLRSMDSQLKDLQNQVTRNQTLTLSLQEVIENPPKRSGQELSDEIQSKSPKLADFLQKEGFLGRMQSADAQNAQSLIQEIYGNFTGSLKDLYSEINQNLQRSQIELENIKASGLTEKMGTQTIDALVMSLKDDIHSMMQNIKADHVGNLIQS